MEKMYNHINDCWIALRELKSLDDLEDTLDNFPRWSGDWEIEVDVKNEVIKITNTYYDEQSEDWEEDTDELCQFSEEQIKKFAEEYGYDD